MASIWKAMRAKKKKRTKTVGPNRSSKLPWPLFLIAAALQWKVTSAYNIVPIATNVNRPADIRPTRSPKFNSPTASPPRMTVKLSHERNVRSFAKNTFTFQGQSFRRLKLREKGERTLGSTRVGRAMRLPGALWRSGWEDIVALDVWGKCGNNL